jgi:hypothetical protein
VEWSDSASINSAPAFPAKERVKELHGRIVDEACNLPTSASRNEMHDIW